MSVKWTESTMLNFLKLYRQHRCLWDSRLDTYKYKEAREAALNSIVKEMNIADLTTCDVKTKIKTVRTMYKKEHVLVSKSRRFGVGSDRLYVPKLFWYKQADAFLNVVTKRRDSFSNPNLSQNEEFIIDDVEVKSEVMDDTTETSENMDIASSAYSSNEMQEQQILNETQNPEPLTFNRSGLVVHAPRSLKRKMVQDLTGAIEKLDNIVDNWKSSRVECENEFDIFGKHIAVQLKQMPLFDALICQEQMQTVLRQKRLEIIMRQSQNTTNSTPLNPNDSQYLTHS